MDFDWFFLLKHSISLMATKDYCGCSVHVYEEINALTWLFILVLKFVPYTFIYTVPVTHLVLLIHVPYFCCLIIQGKVLQFDFSWLIYEKKETSSYHHVDQACFNIWTSLKGDWNKKCVVVVTPHFMLVLEAYTWNLVVEEFVVMQIDF